MGRTTLMTGALLLGVALSACGGEKTVTETVTVTAATTTAAGPAPPSERVLYGTIHSLTRKDGRFELRFDPALFLSGTAAEHAAVEDGALAPGEPVPNDNYIVDETHRLLTYVVSPDAHVTVVTRGPKSTAIPVSELAAILQGKNPKHRQLYDTGNHLGYWIRVGDKYPNPVIALDQQYRP